MALPGAEMEGREQRGATAETMRPSEDVREKERRPRARGRSSTTKRSKPRPPRICVGGPSRRKIWLP